MAGAPHDWDGRGVRYAWSIARVRRLARPVLLESTGQTGFGPRSFEVFFAPFSGAGLEAVRPSDTQFEAGPSEGPVCHQSKGRENSLEHLAAALLAGSSHSESQGAACNDLVDHASCLPRGEAEQGPVRADGFNPGDYFESQVGAWCGMHALNNLLGGPYVSQADCRSAALEVRRRLTQAGAGDVEDLAQHLNPETGWLSIDVINVLGAGLLGAWAGQMYV